VDIGDASRLVPYQQLDPPRVPSFNSEKIAFAIRTASHHCKVFQIRFSKRDGSLFVSFPYHLDCPGILCHATLRAGKKYPGQLDLTESGKFTSHKVKYSHHPDGNVHVSQDGKIQSQIRKRSVALGAARGHLFTVQAQGFAEFKQISPGEVQPDANARNTRINFEFPGEPPAAVKFVAHYYSESYLSGLVSSTGTGPWVAMTLPDKTQKVGAIIQNPYLTEPERSYLLLFVESTPLLDADRHSTLLFMGGFDQLRTALDHTKDTSFLALAYPSATHHTLLAKLGTVDYQA
jgi:hypothetical protein